MPSLFYILPESWLFCGSKAFSVWKAIRLRLEIFVSEKILLEFFILFGPE